MTGAARRRGTRGDGSVYWDVGKQRWVAAKIVGYDGQGRRIRKIGTGKSETAARRSLREQVKAYEAGLVGGWETITVSRAVEQWLEADRSTVSPKTRKGNEEHFANHIKPHLGGRKVKDLRVEEVDRWLRTLAPNLSTSTLKQIRSVLRRSITLAMKRGYADRNVVELSTLPQGRVGRPSKSLTFEQAQDVLGKTRSHHMYPYIAVSLLTGLRPEEVRALTWDHVHVEFNDQGREDQAYIEVWRADRFGGDTKTVKSRRTLAISTAVVEALAIQRDYLADARDRAGADWREHNLVFPSQVGSIQDRHNILRMFRDALKLVPGITPGEWTTRELRHSFVSILSMHGMPIEEISRLMGHATITVTELVYRKELRPVLQGGARLMDNVFQTARPDASTPTDTRRRGAVLPPDKPPVKPPEAPPDKEDDPGSE